MMELEVTGLDEVIAALEGLGKSTSTGIHAVLLARAESVRARFMAATPVRTGKAQAGWTVRDLGFVGGWDTVAVENPVRSDRGFPYPSALLTGTGRRGSGATPTAGYSGLFAATPGMMPNAALQTAWNDEASRPLATPVFPWPRSTP